MLEFFRSSAVRVAIALVIATVVATTGIFGMVYFQIKSADQRSNRLILEDEAAKSVNHSVDEPNDPSVALWSPSSVRSDGIFT